MSNVNVDMYLSDLEKILIPCAESELVGRIHPDLNVIGNTLYARTPHMQSLLLGLVDSYIDGLRSIPRLKRNYKVTRLVDQYGSYYHRTNLLDWLIVAMSL